MEREGGVSHLCSPPGCEQNPEPATTDLMGAFFHEAGSNLRMPRSDWGHVEKVWSNVTDVTSEPRSNMHSKMRKKRRRALHEKFNEWNSASTNGERSVPFVRRWLS